MSALKPPTLLLKADRDPANWEQRSVAEKFSRSDAIIGEDNVDFVALGHMNDQATAYWLSKFLDYLQQKAPADSFHFESMLFKLSNNVWAVGSKEHLSAETRSDIRDFLIWLKDQPFMVDAPPLRQASYDYAVELWR